MSSLAKCVLVLSLALSAVSLATPHIARSANHHRDISARVALPNVHLPVVAEINLDKRGRRCKPRPTTSESASSTESPAPLKKLKDPNPPQNPEQTTTPPPPPPPPPTKSKSPPPPPKATPPPPKQDPPPSGGGNNEPSFMHGTQVGQGTFYSTGLGACGIVNNDHDYIAAVSHLLFDTFPGYNGANPNNNPMCGRKVRVDFEGKSIVVALTDRCEACALTDLDFSPDAFRALADPDRGRIDGIKWTWI